MYRVAQFRNNGCGRALGANLEEHLAKCFRELRIRRVALGVDAWVHVGEFGGPDDSDDFIGVCGVVFRTQAKTVADGVFRRKIFFVKISSTTATLGEAAVSVRWMPRPR